MEKECGFAGIAWMQAGLRGHPRIVGHGEGSPESRVEPCLYFYGISSPLRHACGLLAVISSTLTYFVD